MTDDIPDPDDIDSIDGLRDAIEALTENVDRIDGNVTGLFARAGEFDERLGRIEERLDTLEEQVDLVDATMPQQQKGKLEKVQAILEYAIDHGSGGHAGVKVDTGEATAAAGSSRDTARRLMDEIGGSFPWADVETPGGPKPKQLKLRIRDRTPDELMSDVRAHYNGGAEA